VANGDGRIYEPQIGFFRVTEGRIGSILLLAFGHAVEAGFVVDFVETSEHGEDVDGGVSEDDVREVIGVVRWVVGVEGGAGPASLRDLQREDVLSDLICLRKFIFTCSGVRAWVRLSP
jgi:hypothetical protein